MALNYEINARLRLQGGGSSFGRTMDRMSGRVRAFADRLRGAQSIVGGLGRTLLSLGAGYVGFRAIEGAIRGAVGGMMGFQQQVEATRIGLQSVLAATQGTSFAEAGEAAQAVWESLAQDALASTATTQEMFDIFQGIVGPISAAGESLNTVREITNSTVSAASALGVDFAQAQRDIGLMVRGTAGMDTRMFALLRSMGLITQETQEWNQNMTTGQRIEALQTALGSFDDAASAYGRSFAGVTSSFRDIVSQLGLSLSGPVFQRLADAIHSVNERLLANREAITAALEAVGERAAAVFSRVFDAAWDGVNWIIDHWDTISQRFQDFANTMRAQAPHLARLAAAVGALSTLRSFLVPVLTVVSSLLEIGEMLGAGAAGEAAGGAAGGAGGAAIGLGPLALIVAAIGGFVSIFVEHWNAIVQIGGLVLAFLEPLWRELQLLAQAVWPLIEPIMRLIATLVGMTIISTIGGLFIALVGVLRVVVNVLIFFFESLQGAARVLGRIVDSIINAIFRLARSIAETLGFALGARGSTKTGRGTGSRASGESFRFGELPGFRFGEDAEFARQNLMNRRSPNQRPTRVQNFHRGAVQVRQEFRQADPDRVMVRMINDIDAQAERRVQSGFAPALTR